MILLFYKRLVEPGGAERLLINQYKEFKKLDIDVKIVTRSIATHEFFEEIQSEDLYILGENSFLAFCKGVLLFFSSLNSKIICSSGHVDVLLYTLLGLKKYYLKIHHPAFMSFNDFDKYCYFYKNKFHLFSQSNFGAKIFFDIRANLSIVQKIFINFRGLLSLIALKRALKIFVLSELAKAEKKNFFGVDSIVEKGAIDKTLLSLQPKKIDKYDNFDFKIFTLARLDENKRINVLIDAFSMFCNQNPNSVLVIGGQGPELDNLRNHAEKSGVGEKIIFTGFIPDKDVFSYYSMADIFVSIDWADYRITSYEALAMGTKVILSIETDNDLYLEKSKFLKLVEPTPKSTSLAMLELLENETNISIDQLHEYLERYTWTMYTQSILTHIGFSKK